jgi:hypothetical protein
LTISELTDNVTAMADERIGAACRVRHGAAASLAAVAAILFTSGCSLVLDFGEKTDAGPETDAVVVDAGPVGDGGDPCAAFEPNDSLAETFEIVAGSYSPVAICPTGDNDYFSFVLDAPRDAVIEAVFANLGGAGDLEMRLYNSSGENIDNSETFTDNERIERSLAQSNQLIAGTYIVQIYGFGNTVENSYELVLTLP